MDTTLLLASRLHINFNALIGSANGARVCNAARPRAAPNERRRSPTGGIMSTSRRPRRANSRHALALALGLLQSACGSTPASSYDGTHHFDDAERYLKTVGLPKGLPELQMKYKVGSWGRKLEVAGSATVITDPTTLKGRPTIEWEAEVKDDNTKAKYMLLMIDPDSPTRDVETDGELPGTAGPVLHWLGLNCEDSAESCYQAIPYVAPSPNPGTGRHRYIYILFEQTKPPPSMESWSKFLSTPTRTNWDLGGFLDAMKDCMAPLAMNFLYATVDEAVVPEPPAPPPAIPQPSGGLPRGSGQSGLGPKWDPTARPKHDEL